MNAWDFKAPAPAAALLAYAFLGQYDWPFRLVVLAALLLWFVITAATGLTAMYASARDDAEIHHETGVAGHTGSWAAIAADGIRLGAAPFLWLALAGFAAAALGAEAIPRPAAGAVAALGAAIFAFATGLAAYAAHVRACERRFRAR